MVAVENQIAVIHGQPRELTAAEQHAAYIDERRDLIKRTYAAAATDVEFEMFLELCKTRGLNPFTKQIYLIPRTSHGRKFFSPEISIDGLRLIASRSREYAGGDPYEFDAEPDGRNRPLWAACTVYRMVHGTRCPFTARVYWAEFGGSQNLWQTMPFHMLGKTAESHALRRAFPEETSGIYTTEEMDGATEAVSAPAESSRKPTLVFPDDALDQSLWTPMNALTLERGLGPGPHKWSGYLTLLPDGVRNMLKTNERGQYSAQQIYKAVAAIPVPAAAPMKATVVSEAAPADPVPDGDDYDEEAFNRGVDQQVAQRRATVSER